MIYDINSVYFTKFKLFMLNNYVNSVYKSCDKWRCKTIKSKYLTFIVAKCLKLLQLKWVIIAQNI